MPVAAQRYHEIGRCKRALAVFFDKLLQRFLRAEVGGGGEGYFHVRPYYTVTPVKCPLRIAARL